MLVVNQQLNEAIREMKSSLSSLKATVDGMNTVVMQISAQKVNFLNKMSFNLILFLLTFQIQDFFAAK
jgi:hypothetical protein